MKFHNILGAVQGNESKRTLAEGLATVEQVILGHMQGNHLNMLNELIKPYVNALMDKSAHAQATAEVSGITQGEQDGNVEAGIDATLSTAVRDAILNCCDEYMQFVSMDRPIYVTHIAHWLTQGIIEELGANINQDIPIEIPSRRESRNGLADYIKWYRESKSMDHQEAIQRHKDWHSLEVSRTSEDEGRGAPPRNGIQFENPAEHYPPQVQTFEMKMEDGDRVHKDFKLVQFMKHCSYITADVEKFKGDPFTYAQFRCDIKHICEFYESDDVEVVLSAMTEQYRVTVRRKLTKGMTASGLIKIMDMEYLNATISMHELDYDRFAQSRNESLADYIARFERLIQIRESLFGLMDTRAKARKFRSGIRGKDELEANRICDPAQLLGYEEFKQALTMLYSHWKTSTPTPPSIGFGAVRHRGENKCFRCNLPGHFADKCSSPIVYNTVKRCQKCGTTTHATSACKHKGLHCKRCNKEGHLAGICRGRLTKDTDEQTEVIGDLKIDNDTIKIQSMRSSIQDYSGIVDMEPWLEEIQVLNGNRSCKIRDCLKDTGASASFIHMDVAGFLKKNNMVQLTKEVNLTVEYANGTTEHIQECIVLMCKSASTQTSHEIPFLVTTKCSPRVILGRPILKELKVDHTTVECRAIAIKSTIEQPWIEEQTNRLVARCPLLETATVLPYREKKRNFSITDMRICHARMTRMELEGKVERVEAKDCHILLAPRLVDKENGIRQYTNMEDDKLHSRYRVTLDCRPLNELQLIEGSATFMLLPPDNKSKKPANQSQLGGRDILNSLPLGPDSSRYCKIDLSDAYSSVLIPPGLSRLLAVSTIDENGNPSYFRWRCLPQGWRHSPFLFSLTIDTVLRRLDKDLDQLSISARHYQDDIILTGQKDDELNVGMQLVIDTLESWGFKINKNKCTFPTDEIIFCGYHIEGGKLLPAPKTELTQKLFDAAWENFLKSKHEEKLKWLKEWAGRFQYWRNFINASVVLPALKVFYDQDVDEEKVHLAFSTLFNACVQSIPIHFGFTRSLYNVIVVDANCEAWGGILFKVLPVGIDPVVTPTTTTGVSKVLPVGIDPVVTPTTTTGVSTSGFEKVPILEIERRTVGDEAYLTQPKEALTCTDVEKVLTVGFDHMASRDDPHMIELKEALIGYGIEPPFNLVPFKLCGDNFTLRERRHSSTQRERLAQLSCFEDCYEYLDSPLILVCDNLNCSLTWHNLDLFGARHLDLWDKLQNCLAGHLWLPRESIPSYADLIARVIGQKNDIAQTIQNLSVDIAEGDSTPSVRIHAALRRDIIKGQRTDTTGFYQGISIAEIYRILASNVRDDTRQSKIAHCRFVLLEGVLFYRSISGDRCVVPNCPTDHLIPGKNVNLRAGLLFIYHDRVCHPGATRLSLNLGKHWYWPQQYLQIKKYVGGCTKCRLALPSRVPSGEGELGSLAIRSTGPWTSLMMDFCTYQGSDFYQDILLIIDCYSHWLFSFAVPDQTSKTVALKLKNLFQQIGIPENIISDNGGHFVNSTIDELSKALGFNVWVGSTYHPRRQGLVERAVGEIKLGIKKMKSSLSEIENDLQRVTMLHNMSPFLFHPDVCPYALVYGKNPRWLVNPNFASEDADIKQIREIWEKARIAHQEQMNDRSIALPRKKLESGMQVIWRLPGNTPVIKTLVQKVAGVGNHWYLSDGRQVPEVQLEAMVDEVPELRLQNSDWEIAKVDDLVLFLRDDHMDVGRIIEIDTDHVLVVNLYMNDQERWAEHGDEYTDRVSLERVIKKVRLTSQGRVDRRYL